MSRFDPMRRMSELCIVEHASSIGGSYCARLLADAGARVIKVEPPEGDPSRSRGPFPDDEPHVERSGLFHYLNAGKQGVTLDVDHPDGRRLLRDMLGRADVFVESNPPAMMDEAGMDWASLHKLNPRMVMTSLTAFGQDGPYRNYIADDLVITCMGGLAYATPGFPDETAGGLEEPPLRPATQVSEFAAGIASAAATLMALRSRGRTGRGSRVDVAQFSIMASMMMWDVATASYLGVAKGRPPDLGPGPMPNVYLPCMDGYVAVVAFTNTHWRRLVAVMGDPDWARSELFETPDSRAEYMDAILPGLQDWTRSRTRGEIFALTQPRGIPCFPAFEVGETVDSDQVRERRSLREIDVGCGSRASVPVSPLRFRRASQPEQCPAPCLGEHTPEILAGLRPDAPERESAGPAGDGSNGAGGSSGLPMSGVRVIDLGHSAAVPFATQWLAFMGAEVIRVESRGHGVSMRNWPPYADGVPGENRSGLFNLFTTNNLSCTLDLSKESARNLAKDLVGISDVVVENLSTGVAERMGFGYEELTSVRPDIVLVSLSAFGRTGPMKDFVGFHSAVAMFSGLAAVTGYPGGHPRIAGSVLPDVLSGAYVALAVVQALYNRETLGHGDYIETAMAESVMSVIPEAIIDYTLNGRQSERIGNSDKLKAPHGVYPCRGDDAWVAISIESDAQWEALCGVVGHPEWANDGLFAGGADRRLNRAELDDRLAGWTSQHEPHLIMRRLQEAGVAAGPVLSNKGVLDDPHLEARGSVITVDHPETGRRRMIGAPWRISDAPPAKCGPAPLLGQHVDYVLGELLSLPQCEIDRLAREGAVA